MDIREIFDQLRTYYTKNVKPFEKLPEVIEAAVQVIEHELPAAQKELARLTDELAALRQATGPDVDVMFLQLMLRHHEGGAGMLSYAAERAVRQQVRNLAAQMLTAQTAEIQSIRQMLAERGAAPLPG